MITSRSGVGFVWLGAALLGGALWGGCGDPSAETAVECAANAPEIIAACPAGTSARVDAQAQDACEGALDGNFDPVELGGEVGVSGACTATGRCQVLCAFLEPCACGVDRISRDEVVCAPCGACGDGACAGGESDVTCPQDCGRLCVGAEERCNGAQREVCNARGRWDTLACPEGTLCREPVPDQTECRAPEECSCTEVSACCDGCRARAVGEPCEGERFCKVDTTCQEDGSCGGGQDRDCEGSITDARCQIASCDEARDQCRALPARSGDLCDEPETPSADHCREGQCVADGCRCGGVNDCCDGCNPRNVGQGCDDGLFCTAATTCSAQGACVGQARDCAAELGVTTCDRASCDEEADACASSPDPAKVGQGCEDDAFCTVGTTCQVDGACGGGRARDCADAQTDDQCQDAPTCDEGADACVITPARVGEPCEDGLFCVDGSVCQPEGLCGGGEAYDCGEADEPQCQSAPVCDEGRDRCVAASAHEGEACDDGNPLSAYDACVAGRCRGVPPHAEVDCSSGECVFIRCQVGWDDADLDCLAGGACANGCEQCQPFADGSVELPDDGIDNDCQGGAEPVNDEARGLYVDVSFTPAGAADCGDSPRGGRACPFTSLEDALAASDAQPWGQGAVKREIYLAAGRITLSATAEVYRPVILIGGYTRTPSGPWTQEGARTELVHRDPSRAALYLSMDTYGLTVLDRLTISPLIDVQGPNHGDLALLRVTRLDDSSPLELNIPFGGDITCGDLWMDHVSLSAALVTCERIILQDSVIVGDSTGSLTQTVLNSPGRTMHGIRNLIRDYAQGYGGVGSFNSNSGGMRFIGNRIEARQISVGAECLDAQQDCIVYGNELIGFTSMSGNEFTYAAQNRFWGGLSVGYSNAYVVSRLRLVNNLIVQDEHMSSGLLIQVTELRGNYIWMNQIGLDLVAPRAINNTIILDLPFEHHAALSLGVSSQEVRAVVDSNVFVSSGPLTTFLASSVGAEEISIRNNLFISEGEVPFLTDPYGSVVRTLTNLNRYGGLPECGRGGNQWFGAVGALGWESEIPGVEGYGVPGAESPQIDAGLSPPYSCEGVRVEAQAQDLRGNPRRCGAAVDVGAFERCP
jgi:hypothetical protein